MKPSENPKAGPWAHAGGACCILVELWLVSVSHVHAELLYIHEAKRGCAEPAMPSSQAAEIGPHCTEKHQQPSTTSGPGFHWEVGGLGGRRHTQVSGPVSHCSHRVLVQHCV